MTLLVTLVTPEEEIWSGNAGLVIAKTLDGDIGVLTGHAPVLGVLAPGSLVRILQTEGDDVVAAVTGGFLAVADDRISVLAAQAELGSDVDVQAVRSELDRLLAESGTGSSAAAEPSGVEYARALLRAAGQ
ncbi:MAG TPA: F0F1 ATP synthase subunit epsilon [Streptosporangiaceae bacterium]|nr:F0F1 ATP synthase subunit epsilon [Streptosporangiaceae bacterium]